MADATQARSDIASRNDELRQSDIAALCGLIGSADHLSLIHI